MWLELPNLSIALLNGLGIPAAHLGLSWAFTRMPLSWFQPERFPFHPLPTENADIYDRLFHVRSWKGRLPDAAPWFGGFAKKQLRSAGRKFLQQFRDETCRSEASHWAQVLVISGFVLWTPWPWSLLILAYALTSNLPCILLQRQNRLRLNAILRKHELAT